MYFPNYPTEVPKYGAQGQTIKNMQATMNVVFYKYPVYKTLDEDGYFGNNTEEAVRRIQQHVGLEETGVVDIYTWSAIFCLGNIIAEP